MRVCIFGVCVSCPFVCAPPTLPDYTSLVLGRCRPATTLTTTTTTLTIGQWLNENGHPQGTGLEELRDAQLSHRVLSLSYRPESSYNVRVSAVSSSKAHEVVPRSRPTVEDVSSSGSCRDAKPQAKQWSSMNVLDYRRPSSHNRAAERTIEPGRTGRDDPKDRIVRPLERAADCGWHAGMLEGRSKSFVLPDHCLRRSTSPIGDRPAAIRSTLLQATTDEQHRHRHHHHHHHHHQHQRISPTSSSSTSSSTISSTNHIMLSSPSSTTSSVTIANVQPSVSRVRGYNIIDK